MKTAAMAALIDLDLVNMVTLLFQASRSCDAPVGHRSRCGEVHGPKRAPPISHEDGRWLASRNFRMRFARLRAFASHRVGLATRCVRVTFLEIRAALAGRRGAPPMNMA